MTQLSSHLQPTEPCICPFGQPRYSIVPSGKLLWWWNLKLPNPWSRSGILQCAWMGWRLDLTYTSQKLISTYSGCQSCLLQNWMFTYKMHKTLTAETRKRHWCWSLYLCTALRVLLINALALKYAHYMCNLMLRRAHICNLFVIAKTPMWWCDR